MFSALLNEYGKEFTMDLKVRMMGKPENVTLKLLIDEHELADKISMEQLKDILKERKIELFTKIEMMPGISFIPSLLAYLLTCLHNYSVTYVVTYLHVPPVIWEL